MVYRRGGLILLWLAIALVGSATHAHTPPAGAQTPPAVRVPNHVVKALPHATNLGHNAQADGQQLTLTVVLNRSDQAGFDSFLTSVQAPGSPGFHQFASQAALTNRYGPSPQAYDAVLAFLQQQGFTLVHDSDNRLTLTVQGTRAQAEQALVEVRVLLAAGGTARHRRSEAHQAGRDLRLV